MGRQLNAMRVVGRLARRAPRRQPRCRPDAGRATPNVGSGVWRDGGASALPGGGTRARALPIIRVAAGRAVRRRCPALPLSAQASSRRNAYLCGRKPREKKNARRGAKRKEKRVFRVRDASTCLSKRPTLALTDKNAQPCPPDLLLQILKKNQNTQKTLFTPAPAAAAPAAARPPRPPFSLATSAPGPPQCPPPARTARPGTACPASCAGEAWRRVGRGGDRKTDTWARKNLVHPFFQ